MSALQVTELTARTVVALDGAETRAFLQRILTGDIDAVSESRAAYAALLTPQGKILFDLFVAESDGRFLLDCAASQKDEVVKRLTMYKLRAKIDIADVGADYAVAALWGDEVATPVGAPADAAPLSLFADPRTADVGYRAILPRAGIDGLAADLDATVADEAAYHGHRIAHGLADSDADIGSARTFPHEANLDQLGGVDASKGCYVGQEVVSRMQHRGTVRKRILPVRFDGPPPAPGTDVTAGTKSVGTMLSGLEGHALALLRLDRAQAAFDAGEGLAADGRSLSVERPAWATFPVPGTGVAA